MNAKWSIIKDKGLIHNRFSETLFIPTKKGFDKRQLRDIQEKLWRCDRRKTNRFYAANIQLLV
mgnify:CR=1 FL=1